MRTGVEEVEGSEKGVKERGSGGVGKEANPGVRRGTETSVRAGPRGIFRRELP